MTFQDLKDLLDSFPKEHLAKDVTELRLAVFPEDSQVGNIGDKLLVSAEIIEEISIIVTRKKKEAVN